MFVTQANTYYLFKTMECIKRAIIQYVQKIVKNNCTVSFTLKQHYNTQGIRKQFINEMLVKLAIVYTDD